MSRTGIMLAHPFEQRYFDAWRTNGLCYIQPKIDGLRCRALVHEEHGVQLFSSEGNQIHSLPSLVYELENMNLPDGLHLDGELYSPDIPFEQICSVVKRRESTGMDGAIEYRVFDLVAAGTFADRTRLLNKLPETMLVQRVETTTTHYDAIPAYVAKYMHEGYEGAIVRNPHGQYETKRSYNVLKIKPTKIDTYVVVGVEEEISKDGLLKGRTGAIVCVAPSNLAETFSVGSGLTDEDRERTWAIRDSLTGRTIVVEYQKLTEKGMPRFPIFCRFEPPL